MGMTDKWWDKLASGTDRLANAVGIKDNESKRLQNELMMKTLSEIENIPLPELEQLNLENPNWLSDLQYQDQGASEFNNIELDPMLRDKQRASLAALDEIAASGGLTFEDRANLAKIESQAATADRGRREAIKQNMAMRGMGGSGLELLSQLQSSQDATNQQSQRGLGVAGMAQQRALNAIMQSGSLAGDIHNQDYREQSNLAQAQDAINRFNANNTNETARYNNQGRQKLENMRVDNANIANKYNSSLPQQNYNNQMNQITAKGQARGQQIGMIGEQSRDERNTNANMWGAGIKGFTKLFDDDEE